MPKGKAFDALRHRRGIPAGMFSTLEDLIEAAPQERMTAQQWREYLSPGRILEREGVSFPLKKEEIEYAKLEDILRVADAEWPGKPLEKEYVRGSVSNMRPRITSTGMTSIGGGNYNQYSTQGPNRLQYWESETNSPDVGKFKSHFEDDNIMWSRGSRHLLNPEYKPKQSTFELNSGHAAPPGSSILRLVDEIQSDRHSAAAERDRVIPPGPLMDRFNAGESYEDLGLPPAPRRGYRTPTQQARFQDLQQLSGTANLPSARIANTPIEGEFRELARTPPDAPFKSPADQARFELKKGVLSAIGAGDEFLGVTPSAGPIDWFGMVPDGLEVEEGITPEIAGMQYSYDKIYPGELRKLAGQYGAPMTEVDLPVTTSSAGRIGVLRDAEMDLPDYLDNALDFVRDDEGLGMEQYHDLLEGYEDALPDEPRVRSLVNLASERLNQFEEAVSQGIKTDPKELETVFYDLDRIYQEVGKFDPVQRKIPAMQLTPEIVEKIKKAGIPLWAIAGGLVGTEALMEEDKVPSFGKGGIVGKAFDADKSFEAHGSGRKMPYGMFSTLEDLIEAAPAEKMTAKQWREYLAPGRMLLREDVSFPLKKEELDWALPDLATWGDEGIIERENLHNFVLKNRPAIQKTRQSGSPYSFDQYSTHGPYRKGYFESLTEAPGLGRFPTHYTDKTLSWHRGSLHDVDVRPGRDPRMFPDASGGTLRLIDEIQSDRHSAAGEKVDRDATGATYGVPTRRGYLTPEQEKVLKRDQRTAQQDGQGWHRGYPMYDRAALEGLTSTPPDAPFKTPADYGRLELKKGILDSIYNTEWPDRYVGITPSQGPIGWFGFNPDGLEIEDPRDLAEFAKMGELTREAAGAHHVYDKVYPGELKKLAQQYKAPFQDVEVDIEMKNPLDLDILQAGDGMLDLPDFFMELTDSVDDPQEMLESVGPLSRELANKARTLIEGGGNFPGVQMALDRAEYHHDAFTAYLDHNRVTGINDDPDTRRIFNRWQDAINVLHHELVNAQPQLSGKRKVPSMELTPEVIERIKKAGIPLWAIAGGVVGTEALMEEDKQPGFSVGGAVDPDNAGDTDENGVPDEIQAHMDMINKAFEQPSAGLRGARAFANGPASSESGRQRRKHLLTGLLGQLYGLNTENKPTFLGFDERRAGPPMSSPIAGILSKLRPGLVDDTMAMPSYFNFIPGVKQLDNPVSQDAAARQEFLESEIRRIIGNEDEPDTLSDDLAYNTGIMLGQLPVPTSAAKTAITKVGPGVLKAIGRGAKGIGSSAVEFFSPIINPKPGNYASGAAFGTALSSGMRELSELAEGTEERRRALKEKYGRPGANRQRDPGFATGGETEVKIYKPQTPVIPAAAPAAPYSPTRYVGQPRTEAEMINYGSGPEQRFFENNQAPMNVDFTDWSTPAVPSTGGGGTANKVAGTLASLPAVWKGIGYADKLLGTGMQAGLKKAGTGVLSKIGLGGGAAAAAPLTADAALAASLAPVGAEGAAIAGAGAAGGSGTLASLGAVAAPAAMFAATGLAFYNSLKKEAAHAQGKYDSKTGQISFGTSKPFNQSLTQLGANDNMVLERLLPILQQTGTTKSAETKAALKAAMPKPEGWFPGWEKVQGAQYGIKMNKDKLNASKAAVAALSPEQAADWAAYSMLNSKNSLWTGKGDIVKAMNQWKEANPGQPFPI